MEDIKEEFVQNNELKRSLSEVDRLALELAKSRRQIALAKAETALAQQESAEISYRYTILQIYMKYGLTEKDAIDESGNIVFNGALDAQNR